jgi:DNA-directed RNA polymerase I, II, and III subunit RPABC2
MADDADYDAGAAADDVPADDMEELELGAAETLAAEEAAAAVANNPLSALLKHHPECILEYAEAVALKLPLISSPPVNDPNHRSVPFLTQYERTKIIGMRANQLSQGARPYVPIPEHVTDVADIARIELAQRRLPFIIRRPMPDGTMEYWRLADLMQL